MQKKEWYKSKGVLGGVAVLSVLVTWSFGVDISEVSILELLEKGTIFIGALTAMYGRITAKTVII